MGAQVSGDVVVRVCRPGGQRPLDNVPKVELAMAPTRARWKKDRETDKEALLPKCTSRCRNALALIPAQRALSNQLFPLACARHTPIQLPFARRALARTRH